MSGRSHHQFFCEVYVSCSRTQHGDLIELIILAREKNAILLQCFLKDFVAQEKLFLTHVMSKNAILYVLIWSHDLSRIYHKGDISYISSMEKNNNQT